VKKKLSTGYPQDVENLNQFIDLGDLESEPYLYPKVVYSQDKIVPKGFEPGYFGFEGAD
jgi:hypothetical protein